MADNKDLQGEGNYDASRRYRKGAEEFVESGRVEDAAENAKPKSKQERDDLERAEEIGRAGNPPEESEP